MLDSGMLGGGLEEADKVFSHCLFDEPVLLDVWNMIPEHPLQAEEPDGDRHWIADSPTLQVWHTVWIIYIDKEEKIYRIDLKYSDRQV